jgi:hypothetical protein
MAFPDSIAGAVEIKKAADKLPHPRYFEFLPSAYRKQTMGGQEVLVPGGPVSELLKISGQICLSLMF